MGFNKKSKLVRSMEGPIKILARALDSYVRNILKSGAHVFYGSSMSSPTPQLGSLPRNIGVSSFNSGHSSSSEEYLRSSSPMSRQDVATPVPRRRSDQIGRIDDDKFSESGADRHVVVVVVHPKGICSAAKRRRKIASVDHDLTTNVKYERI